MKNAETNDKKFAEFLTACVVKQVKAQGFVPLSGSYTNLYIASQFALR